MSDQDAKFEDGGERPLRLLAEDVEDLQVLASLAQDAVFPVSEISWQPAKRRFALLLNRFRWEDADAAQTRGRAPERVQSVLAFDDITGVKTQGVSRDDPEMILSLLSIAFTAGEDGTGQFELTLAGDGAFSLQAECINVTLQDVTRPYIAPSKSRPQHPE